MLQNLSSDNYDTELCIDNNRYDRKCQYTCKKKKFDTSSLWLVVHLIYITILVGLIVAVYFNRQEVMQLRREVKQCNQIKSSTDEMKSSKQTMMNDLVSSSIHKTNPKPINNENHHIKDNKDTIYDQVIYNISGL